MLFLRLLKVLFRDVAKDLLRHRGQHLLAILTLASGLILAGGGLLAVESLDRWVSGMESQAKVTVFATEGGRLEETEGLLKRDPRFQGVKRITSQEGTRRFLETSREAGLILESLGNEPIPESLELTLRAELMAAHKAVEVGESLRKLPGVGDVIVDQQRLESLQKTARLVRQALSLLGLLLLVAAGFSTGNVIRMSVLSREEEISIMRLVGASCMCRRSRGASLSWPCSGSGGPSIGGWAASLHCSWSWPAWASSPSRACSCWASWVPSLAPWAPSGVSGPPSEPSARPRS